MSNDMIMATYKLATIAMVEGAVLLWMGADIRLLDHDSRNDLAAADRTCE